MISLIDQLRCRQMTCAFKMLSALLLFFLGSFLFIARSSTRYTLLKGRGGKSLPSGHEPHYISTGRSTHIGTASNINFSSSSHRLLQKWDGVKCRTQQLSLKCRNFMLISVFVNGGKVESQRHFIPHSPQNMDPNCALMLIVGPYGRNEQHNKSVQKSKQLGWKVVDLSIDMEADLTRRFSRYPKLAPSHFFPFTDVVLYSDLNCVDRIRGLNPEHLAHRLLAGTSFGIIQHEKSETIQDERQAIIAASRTRPLVDSVDRLQKQVMRISNVASRYDLKTFGIWGGFHAHKLLGVHNSKAIDEIWLQEYMQGCDRDQIAFYMVGSLLKLERVRLDGRSLLRSTNSRRFL